VTTVSDLVEETRRYLLTTQRDPINKLSVAIDTDDTTLTFEHDLRSLTAGSYLGIDLEVLYVWEVNPTAKTAIVERAMQGSTAAAHTADTLAYVNPKFSTFSIFQAINAELESLPSMGVFAVEEWGFTYLPSQNTYQLSSTAGNRVIDILEVRWEEPGAAYHWPRITSYKLRRDIPIGGVTVSSAITLYEGAVAGRQVSVMLSSTFIPFASLSSDVTSSFMVQGFDILALGAALRLSGVRELARNFFEEASDTRRASEVPARAQIGGMESYARLYANRVHAEARRIASEWPQRRRLPVG
jgi:hypothetical protein